MAHNDPLATEASKTSAPKAPHPVEGLAISGKTAADIAESIRDLVDSGRLAPASQLPPVRTLAKQLDVNRNTVVNAYGLLVQAGVAQTRGRAGTRIASFDELPQEGFTSGTAEHVVDLGSGNPDPKFLPSPAAALTQLAATEPVLYGESVVDPDLRAWAEQIFRADGVSDFRLTVTAGSADALDRLLSGSLVQGDALGFEQPCFLTSIHTAQAAGYRVVPVPVDEQGPTVAGVQQALASGVRTLVVTPRAHNPTGASISAQRAAQIRTVLADYPHVLVIEDDHYWMQASGEFHTVVPPGHPRWALIRSVSKAFGPDLRLAMVASDPQTAERLGARIRSGSMWVSHLLQRLTYLLATDPEAMATVTAAQEHYRNRTAATVAALEQLGLTAHEQDGVNLWVDVARPADDVAQQLMQAGWLVRPGSDFSVDDSGTSQQHIRITPHVLDDQALKRFIEDLGSAVGAAETSN